MIERIKINEERLDNVLLCINNINNALKEYQNNINNIKELNKYYGSRKWFDDKENYENKKIENIKAGILSEDTVWNMNEDLKNMMEDMKQIVIDFENNKEEIFKCK